MSTLIAPKRLMTEGGPESTLTLDELDVAFGRWSSPGTVLLRKVTAAKDQRPMPPRSQLWALNPFIEHGVLEIA